MKRLATSFLMVVILGMIFVGHAQAQNAEQGQNPLSPADLQSQWSIILKPFLEEGFLKSWKISVDSYVGGLYLYPAQEPFDRNMIGLQYRQPSDGMGLGFKMRPTIFAEAIFHSERRFGIGLSGSAFASRGTGVADQAGLNGSFLRFVENELSTESIELFGWKRAYQASGKKLDLLGGVKLAQFTVRRSEGENPESYTYNFFKPGLSFYGRVETERVAIANEGLIVGPFIGVRLVTHMGQMQFTGILKQSVLFGTRSDTTSTTQGNHKQTTEVNFPCFIGLGKTSESLVGCNANVLIPVTEVRLKVSRRIGDRFSLGAGVYSSLWFNVPGAPVFPAPGSCPDEPCKGETPDPKARIFVAGLFSIKW
ncbi:MAG: hypothetical protein Q7R93_02525 [bacterium]|nr:hypothetical protein [bacterium]